MKKKNEIGIIWDEIKKKRHFILSCLFGPLGIDSNVNDQYWKNEEDTEVTNTKSEEHIRSQRWRSNDG